MNRKPDIIVINPDQMRADALHHLGNKASNTPNMDALAQEGVSFDNAFCQNPVCVPSRCSFMTGLYPHTTGHRTMSYLLREVEDNFGIVLDDYEPRIKLQQSYGAEHTKALMIRTREYKYVLRLYEADEFYDLSNGEEKNEIDNPEYKMIVEELRSKLFVWLFETSDIVPYDKDKRQSDDFYLETVDAYTHIKLKPLIKVLMKLTGNDLNSLAFKFKKLFKVDSGKFNKGDD